MHIHVAVCCSHFCTLLSSEPNADADVPDHVRLVTEPARLLPPHDGWLPSLAERAHAQPPLWVHATWQQAQYSTRADGHGCGLVAHDQSQRCWRAHGRVAEDAAADPIPAGEHAPLGPNAPTVSIPFVAHLCTVLYSVPFCLSRMRLTLFYTASPLILVSPPPSLFCRVCVT